jgi:O-antigen ligase
MRDYLIPLLFLQRFIVPSLVILAAWAIWRTVVRKDFAVGLALYVSLVVIVDGFLNTGIYLPGLEKGSLRYSEICAVVLFFHLPPALPEHRQRHIVSLLILIYFALVFVSVLRTGSVLSGIFDFRRLIVPQIVAFLLARRGFGTPQGYNRFLFFLTILGIIITLFTFWDLFFDRLWLHSDMLFKGEYFHNRKLKRFGSFFLNPNWLGAFIVLIFPPIFIWTLNEQRSWPRRLGWAGLLALAFSLVETQSRAPLLAFGVGLLLLMVGPCGEISRKRRLVFLVAIATAFTVLMPNFFQHAIERFTSLDQEMAEGRTRETTWRYSMNIIEDHPLLGIGFGEQQFMNTMMDYGFTDEFGVDPLDAPHNSYLQVAVYAGLPALFAFLIANTIVLFQAVRVSLQRSDGHHMFGLAVGILAFLLSIYTDLQLFTLHVGPAYWIFFGLLLSRTAEAGEADKLENRRAPEFLASR